MPLFSGLASHGLAPVPVQGDGACFFRAVADQLFHDEQTQSEIREHTVAWMSKHREAYEAFFAPELPHTQQARKLNTNAGISTTQDFGLHLREMSRPHTWATHLEVQATADCYGLDIHIYRSDQEAATQVTISSNFRQQGKPLYRINICFDVDGQHYLSARPVSESFQNVTGYLPVQELAVPSTKEEVAAIEKVCARLNTLDWSKVLFNEESKDEIVDTPVMMEPAIEEEPSMTDDDDEVIWDDWVTFPLNTPAKEGELVCLDRLTK
jgi:hypothetical protein